ncbi:ROK family transcriptional regulator [Streptomyces rubrolavendulae]|uniref:N-acetylglucosamine repressor n=1 Tax=Streptomyces rubrolavendulae TaxID=285473 RepID=A0A1D8G0C6_9ACTN|nr:ROK family transcriptional regulator [Streptomyces rubrolavendulae]AOT58909.1 N-acetylglucosamine repressor [Streptomyces rubrolavendulae]
MAGEVGGATPGTPRVLRAMNDRAALDLMLEHGPLSRARIGTLTGLSKPTASQLLARLEAAGLVVVTGTSEGRPGPGAQLYGVNPRAAYAAGLDVNPRRVLAAVADLTGRVVGEFTLPVPRRERPGAVRQVTDALDGAVRAAGLARQDVHRVVIGTPGAFDPSTGRLRYASHLPGWHGPGLLEELAAALPMPVEYENDVNLVAVAEQRLGAAAGYRDFVLLWSEEGLGAALVLGGRLHRGFTGGAGEVGFMPVPGAPLVRNVARAGSGGFQELAGARVLPALARELGLDVPDRDSPEAAVRLLRAAAEEGGAVAGGEDDAGAYGRLLDSYATGLATGLAALVAVLDPQLVVLSGDVALAGGEPLRRRVAAELAELAAARPRLALGAVRERPVLRGALEAALAATRDDVFDTLAR